MSSRVHESTSSRVHEFMNPRSWGHEFVSSRVHEFMSLWVYEFVSSWVHEVGPSPKVEKNAPPGDPKSRDHLWFVKLSHKMLKFMSSGHFNPTSPDTKVKFFKFNLTPLAGDHWQTWLFICLQYWILGEKSMTSYQETFTSPPSSSAFDSLVTFLYHEAYQIRPKTLLFLWLQYLQYCMWEKKEYPGKQLVFFFTFEWPFPAEFESLCVLRCQTQKIQTHYCFQFVTVLNPRVVGVPGQQPSLVYK